MKIWLIAAFTSTILSVLQVSANEDVEYQTHTLESKLATSTLELEVALPYAYDKEQSYPVFYTTSGGSRFKSLVRQIDWLSHVSMGPMPQFIVVKLPQVTVPSDMHPKYIASSGIANKLQLSVVTQEIIPFINSKYRTQSFKLLEGFSSNGNFVLHTYLANHSLFDGYLAFSPALELDKSGLVKKLGATSISEVKVHIPLYLSLGPFTGNKSLYESIRDNLQHSPATKFEDFSNHNFLSVATLSLSNSVEWFFSDLSPETSRFSKGGLAAVKAYYAQLEKKYKKPMDYSNTLINLSFYYANNDNKNKALETINAVVESEPNNVYYLTRQAIIQKKVGNTKQSQQSFLLAQKLAAKANNDDALSYIKGELSKFQSE